MPEMDILPPFHVVRVSPVSEHRKQVKIKVFVGVDQTREDNGMFKGQNNRRLGHGAASAKDTRYFVMFDMDPMQTLLAYDTEVF
jgi:hypothetical protein